jgi:hypothetical protein
VETTPVPVVDRDAHKAIHEATKAKDLLPDAHLTDAGYVAADQLVVSRKKGITLLRPAPKDNQSSVKNSQALAFLRKLRREVGPILQENTPFCAVFLRFGDRACDCDWPWRPGDDFEDQQ